MSVEVRHALKALGILEWVLRGSPSNETEFNTMFRKITGEDKYGSSIESDDPADFGVTWSQVSAKLTELQNAEPMRLLRKQRNRLLAETDHWAYQDTPAMTQAQTDYRQSLRDITDSYSSLDDVVWPTRPE